ncbi:MAG: TatD family hydrolase [Succinivibrionaceae bacterium]
MFLIDSHCHIDSLDYENIFKDVSEVLNRAKDLGVTHFLCPGVDLESFDRMYDLVKEFNNIWMACAIHPENINDNNKMWTDEEFLKYLNRDKIIAVGETGLDYVCTPETKSIQQESFARQINIAKQTKKPLIIHTRGAGQDTINILKSEEARDIGGVMHCFCDDKDIAKKSLDLGFYISFSGIVTFKNATNVREVCSYVPLDRMLVETDSPYLAPVPKRGKPNEPAFVHYVAKFIAEFKGCSYEELCNITTNNFADCFKVSVN